MAKVTMFNPQSGVTQDASEDAYQRIYAGQGWELVDTPPAKNELDPDLVAVRAEAEKLGLKVHHAAKVDTIRKAIEEHKAEKGGG